MKFVEIISDGTKKGMAVGTFHLLLMLLAYTSPFWLDWRWIALGVSLLFFEQLVFGNCVLNASQYGNVEGMFYENLFTHFHIRFEKSRLRFWLRWIIPMIVLIIALVIQHIGLHALVKF